MPAWLKRVRTLFRRGAMERELDAELEFHLDMLAAEYVRQGAAPDVARRSARQLFGERIHAMLQADPLQHLKGLALLGGHRQTENTHHERDVLKYREPGDEPEVLEDEADAAAERLDLRRPERAQVAAEHLQVAAARQLLTKEKTEKGRFAGAARPRQKDELAFVDGEGKIAESVNATLVELRQM